MHGVRSWSVHLHEWCHGLHVLVRFHLLQLLLKTSLNFALMSHVLCFLLLFFIFFHTFFLSTNVVHQHILLRVVVRPSALDVRLTRFVRRRVQRRRLIAPRVLPKWETTWLLWISSLVHPRQMTVSARRVILMLVPTTTREIYEALIPGAFYAQKVLTVHLLVQILEYV